MSIEADDWNPNCTLLRALQKKLDWMAPEEWSEGDDQRHTILVDLLWKLVRNDWHGVSDAANDLRELHL